jgi:hypothetical protein
MLLDYSSRWATGAQRPKGATAQPRAVLAKGLTYPAVTDAEQQPSVARRAVHLDRLLSDGVEQLKAVPGHPTRVMRVPTKALVRRPHDACSSNNATGPAGPGLWLAVGQAPRHRWLHGPPKPWTCAMPQQPTETTGRDTLWCSSLPFRTAHCLGGARCRCCLRSSVLQPRPRRLRAGCQSACAVGPRPVSWHGAPVAP